jgi:hypothetical protein
VCHVTILAGFPTSAETFLSVECCSRHVLQHSNDSSLHFCVSRHCSWWMSQFTIQECPIVSVLFHEKRRSCQIYEEMRENYAWLFKIRIQKEDDLCKCKKTL